MLITALQGLHDAERAMVERLPKIADESSDDRLPSVLDSDAIQSADQQRKIAGLLERREADVEGAPNIWLGAILDDADRDCKTVDKAQLLDIALVGAVRKGKQAERVSYETTIALATQLGGDDAPTLEAIRDEEAATDAALANLLTQLTAG